MRFRYRYNILFYFFLVLALLALALLFIVFASMGSGNAWNLSEQVLMAGAIIILVLLFGIIFYTTRRLSRPLILLRQFIEIVNNPEHKDFSSLKFPNDSFGDVSKKIVDTFEQLEKTKRYKQEMSHNIAHELKTPVTSIRAYLETILHDASMDERQKALFVERAYNQTLRLSSLINDVSTLNKLDEGLSAFPVEEFSVASCIKDVLEEIGYKLQENGIRLELLISSDLMLKGCYSLVYSLFKNLIDNSVEHGGPGILIKIMAGVEQISGEGGYRINFTYMDNGKNVECEKLSRLFERFYRVEEGRSRRKGGTGLGLAIVKNAVLYHKGTISADNNPGGGLIFKFTLYSL